MPGQEIFCPFELNHPLVFTSLEHSPFFIFQGCSKGDGWRAPAHSINYPRKVPKIEALGRGGNGPAAEGKRGERSGIKANRRHPGGPGEEGPGRRQDIWAAGDLAPPGRFLLEPLPADGLGNRKRRHFCRDAPRTPAAREAGSTPGVLGRTRAALGRAPRGSWAAVFTQVSPPPVGHLDRRPFSWLAGGRQRGMVPVVHVSPTQNVRQTQVEANQKC